MPSLAQANRIATVHTPAGADVLVFKSLRAHEALSQLSQIGLEVISESASTTPDDLLGQGITLEIDCPSGQKRFFHGVVSRCALSRKDVRATTYHLELVPWFWFLTRTSNCRVFQKMTVPDILAKVFRDAGFNDFEPRLQGSYDQWEYCVQYRETDFNFACRLMEQEGIYYFIKHEMGKDTLVLCDSPGAHEPTPGYESISWRPPATTQDEHIRDWSRAQELKPGKYVHKDYNFETPRNPLLANSANPGSHAQAEAEIYDYPGEYATSGEGEGWAKIRMEELATRHKTSHGSGDTYGICVGATFNYIEALYAADEGNFLVVSTALHLEAGSYETGEETETVYSISFSVIPAATVFRAPRSSEKPLIHGVQTAVVVGPGGEEIYTDKYARIKVQFHWDREGKKNQDSSCWVRVATPWAGKTWGAVSIPRIGQEVVVAFLEGDPDQPIVIGSVYNADQMPVWGMPENKTQSGIQSRSSPGGSDAKYNEICFEDKCGEELLYIRAEKDQTIAVENDEAHWVGHDRTKEIDNDETVMVHHDRTETVDNNETITIGNNRTEKVAKDETITIGGNRTETVMKNEEITILGKRAKKVMQGEEAMILSKRDTTVVGPETLKTAGPRTTQIAATDTLQVAAAIQTVSGGPNATMSGAMISEVAGAAISMTSGGAVMITASAIVLTAAAVTINSPAVVISGRFVKPLIPPIIP